MKKILFKSFLSLTLMAIAAQAFAQQTLNVAGYTANLNGMTFDYSIGEMTLITTEKSSNLIVTQGLLQPNVSTSETIDAGSNTLTILDNLIKVYPNPTTNLLYVETFEAEVVDYSYNLYDAAGRVVLSKKGQTQKGLNKWELNLQSFASGSYYLMMQKNDAKGQPQYFSYKIQKLN